MDALTLTKLKSEWFIEANIELTQKRRRRYLHFDDVIGKVSPFLFRKITDPDFVATYAFFPLIRRAQINRIYKKDPVTGESRVKQKIRPISYAAHFDALIYSWYSYLISYYYEQYLSKTGVEDSVIAYRKLSKSNIVFAKEVFDFISTKEECAVVAFDVEGFYDNLNPAILKGLWARILGVDKLPVDHYKVFRSVSSHAYVEWSAICKALNVGETESEKIKLFLNVDLLGTLRDSDEIKTVKEKGIPQGTPISCVLSNLYMLPFDVAMRKAIDNVGGMYKRYSDDIIIICPRESLVSLESLVEQEIKKARLKIEPSKTERRFFKQKPDGTHSCVNQEGKDAVLQYLGVGFDGASYSLRHKGRAKFERRMVRGVRKQVKYAKEKSVGVRKKGLYEKFSPLGERNYITYVRRASVGLGSPKLLHSFSPFKQLKKINSRILKEGGFSSRKKTP